MNGRGERVRRGTSPEKPPARQATQIQPDEAADEHHEADACVDRVPDEHHARDPERGEQHATARTRDGVGSRDRQPVSARPPGEERECEHARPDEEDRAHERFAASCHEHGSGEDLQSEEQEDRDRPERRPEVLEQGTVEPPVVRSRRRHRDTREPCRLGAHRARRARCVERRPLICCSRDPLPPAGP